MITRSSLAAIAALVVASWTGGPTAALAQPALAGKPIWLRKPSGEQLSALRPLRVVNERTPGGAMLDCTVTTAGGLDGCKVETEAPAGYGFGAAALKAAVLYRAAPTTAEGQSTAGAHVRVPVTFDARRVGGAMSLMNYPIWVRAPTLAMVQAAYPETADGAAGKAVIRCAFDIEGHATDCDVRSESPAGKGFGAAALGLADDFVILHDETDAGVLPGVIADIPVSFRKPESGGRRLPEPNWLNTLTAAATEALFPDAARDARIASGTGTVDCLVSGAGALTDCRVTREQPSALGFGDAALQAAGLLVLSPWTDGGEPFAGRRLTVPIRFRLVTPLLEGNPIWLNRPTAKDLENLHPRNAEKFGAAQVTGGAVLVCLVTENGFLTQCATENENPKDMDFAAAVLETAPLWRMGPRASDGKTTAGTKVRVPVIMPAMAAKP